MAEPGAPPVLLYDGDCRFCVRQAERLRRWAGGRVRLQSFREPGVLARYPQVAAAACEEAMQLVLPDGRVRSGAAAAASLLGLRPWLRPLARLYDVPGIHALADAAYRVVASNRFRLGGRTCSEGTCAPHGRR
jgi:predicted DCC family thiol-disulfide oxidoreductase YuxK